jgi:TPR repeat protein
MDQFSQQVEACTKLPITERFGCLDKMSRDAATKPPLSNPKATASTIPDPAQLKQAPQDREKADKPVRELTAELTQLKQQLQEERGNNEKLASEVKAGLAQLKQAPQDREKADKPVRELTAELTQLKQQLQEERGRPKEPPATDVSQTAQGTLREHPATIATNTAVELEPGIAANNSDTARLLVRASQFLSHGNVGMARMFLELAVEKGSAPATFALAETYDPAVLAAWGTRGTQGDPAKARDLYQKALAGGVQDATDRLQSLDKQEIATPPRR